jgi:hypothetical protein
LGNFPHCDSRVTSALAVMLLNSVYVALSCSVFSGLFLLA